MTQQECIQHLTNGYPEIVISFLKKKGIDEPYFQAILSKIERDNELQEKGEKWTSEEYWETTKRYDTAYRLLINRVKCNFPK